MAQIYNPGAEIIEAFLKGRALKEHREASQREFMLRQQQFEIQTEAQKLRQQQILATIKDAAARQQEMQRWHDLQAQRDKLREEGRGLDRTIRARGDNISFARAFQDNLIEPVDGNRENMFQADGTPNWGNVQFTQAGSAMKQKVLEKGQIATAEAVGREGSQIAVDAARQNKGLAVKMILDADERAFRRQMQGARFDFQKEENRKAQEAALARVKARPKKTEEDKIAAVREALPDIITGVNEGRITKEYLTGNYSQAERSFISNELLKNRSKPLTVKEEVKLSTTGKLNQLLETAEKFDAHLRTMSSVLVRRVDGGSDSFEAAQAAIAKPFSEVVAGDNSILAEREVPRIQGGLVKRNPTGMVGTVTDVARLQNTRKRDDEANATNIKAIKEAYTNGLRAIMSGMNREQMLTLARKYSLRMDLLAPILPKPKKASELEGK